MSTNSDLSLEQKIEEVFRDIVEPVVSDLMNEYNQAPGFEVKLVPDGPLIQGIERYISVMFKHPNGVEMIVCVYWVSGSHRLFAENIRMVTLNKMFDAFSITKEELKEQISFLAGLKLLEGS